MLDEAFYLTFQVSRQEVVLQQGSVFERLMCQRRSKNLPEGGVKVGHCGGQHKAVTGGVKVVQFVG